MLESRKIVKFKDRVVFGCQCNVSSLADHRVRESVYKLERSVGDRVMERVWNPIFWSMFDERSIYDDIG